MNLSKIFNCLVPSFFESKRGSVCLLFIVPFIILVGDEQQIVIHWTSETDSTSSILLKDRNGQILDSGNSNNGDGYLVTLGYFTDGNSTHPFGMDGTKWIPLTS